MNVQTYDVTLISRPNYTFMSGVDSNRIDLLKLILIDLNYVSNESI